MSKPNRKCIICKKEYYYCSGGCREDKNKPLWYASFCGNNCHDVYEIVTGYRDDKLSKNEAANLLSTKNIEIEKYTNATKGFIEEILNEENPVEIKVEVKPEIKEIIEPEEEVVSETIEVAEEKVTTAQDVEFISEVEAESKEDVGIELEEKVEDKLNDKDETVIETEVVKPVTRSRKRKSSKRNN